MKFIYSILLIVVMILSGCGNEQANQIYRVHKDSVTIIDDDIIFESGGQIMTAKGEADKLKSSNEDYLKVVKYSNGNLRIAE
ncbi:hypothetical protein [Psychrobacillus sp. NPDC093180]|uniref:hypothetical protein n=1 Tax=Psychrobacillus sp. NPDC093180 TaxID=3364489 RepID=UPI00381F68A2